MSRKIVGILDRANERTDFDLAHFSFRDKKMDARDGEIDIVGSFLELGWFKVILAVGENITKVMKYIYYYCLDLSKTRRNLLPTDRPTD